MAMQIHDLTVEQLEAAIRALGRETVALGYLRDRMRKLGDSEADYQLQQEDNRISTVMGVLAAAQRHRRHEDRERKFIETGQ